MLVRAVLLRTSFGCALAMTVTVAFAGNGLNDFAFGSDSAGVAGADLAVARDTAALNTNPAGLTQIDDHALNILLEPYSYLDHQYHRDSVGNDVNANNKYGSLIAGGYGRRLSKDIVAAIGLFAQGGAGFVYKDLQTPFGTRDDYSATFGSLKIASGLGWRVSDQLSLGMALGLVYSVARQKVFPETSTEQFSGVRLDGLGGLSAGVRSGLQYRPDHDWVLALAYGSKTPLRLEDGTFTVNNTGSGGSVVRYGNARLSGLSYPTEIGVGTLFHPEGRWSVATKVSWLDWSSAMKATTLRASGPDDTSVPPNLVTRSPLHWRDQYVLALGVMYQWSPATELRGGVSYGRNPIPRETLDPLFAVTAQTAIFAGFVQRLNTQWEASAVAAWDLPSKESYASPLLGASSESFEGVLLYLGLKRSW